jgi:hypothetical protein
VLIRSATPDDYDVIFEIFSEILDLHFRAHPEAFKPPLKDEHFKTFFDGVLRSSNRHLVLGLQDDQPVGYLLFAVGGRKESVTLWSRKNTGAKVTAKHFWITLKGLPGIFTSGKSAWMSGPSTNRPEHVS